MTTWSQCPKTLSYLDNVVSWLNIPWCADEPANTKGSCSSLLTRSGFCSFSSDVPDDKWNQNNWNRQQSKKKDFTCKWLMTWSISCTLAVTLMCLSWYNCLLKSWVCFWRGAGLNGLPSLNKIKYRSNGENVHKLNYRTWHTGTLRCWLRFPWWSWMLIITAATVWMPCLSYKVTFNTFHSALPILTLQAMFLGECKMQC